MNQTFTDELAAELKKLPGLQVKLLRRPEETLTPAQRARRASAGGASVVISIHHDSVAREDAAARINEGRGYSLHVRADDQRSLLLARSVGESLRSAGFVPTGYHSLQYQRVDEQLGIYDRPHLALLRFATVPTMLLECGFLSHPAEMVELLDPVRRRRMAKAVAHGISVYRRQSTKGQGADREAEPLHSPHAPSPPP